MSDTNIDGYQTSRKKYKTQNLNVKKLLINLNYYIIKPYIYSLTFFSTYFFPPLDQNNKKLLLATKSFLRMKLSLCMKRPGKMSFMYFKYMKKVIYVHFFFFNFNPVNEKFRLIHILSSSNMFECILIWKFFKYNQLT